ncbi:hypothetical protein FYJ44_05340 [Desulfovibrio sp. PG-178-WT-4]|uniref:Uncharacterized protein n=1 Tax=Desulfovibrio porci TaxID=2605782 RepID=A0A6L5XJZ8_9BACT|nr:hypothetical protein [Desulfovibrio porci]MSS27484.1 hypothetical protein [Desulfovibrio porci]
MKRVSYSARICLQILATKYKKRFCPSQTGTSSVRCSKGALQTEHFNAEVLSRRTVCGVTPVASAERILEPYGASKDNLLYQRGICGNPPYGMTNPSRCRVFRMQQKHPQRQENTLKKYHNIL